MSMENSMELLKRTGNTSLINKINKIEKSSQLDPKMSKKDPRSQIQNASDMSTHDASESSGDEGENENESRQNPKEIQVDASFKERVVAYIKIDDSIRTKKTEILELKKKLKPCEDFIMQYLDSHIDEEEEKSVNVDNSVIAKQQTVTKGTITVELVKKSVMEGLRKSGFSDEVVVINITNMISEIMEANRKIQTKTRTSLKRKVKQPRKQKAKVAKDPKKTTRKTTAKN